MKDSMFLLSCDPNDLWNVDGRFEDLPREAMAWNEYKPWVTHWMTNNGNDTPLHTTYFEVTSEEAFAGVVNCVVSDVVMYSLNNFAEPFGVKLVFENDYLFSSPTSCGSTVETKIFNRKVLTSC